MLCGWKAFIDLTRRDKDASWQQYSITSQMRQETNTEKQLKSSGEKNLMAVIIKRQQKEKKDREKSKFNASAKRRMNKDRKRVKEEKSSGQKR